jgi:tRNA G18 (ribose-2'-O)-methylase SpoU
MGQGGEIAVVETIADPDDPRLEPYTRMRERDLVGRTRRFIAEGEVTLRLLLGARTRFRAESILLVPERWPGLAPDLAACPDKPPVYLADRAVMSAVTGFPIHRGVLAVGQRGPEPDPAVLVPPTPAPALVLGLAGLTNHDNVGAAFRNAAAFGADAVFLDAASCDPLYRKSIRVSAGAALIQPFARLAPGQDWLALARALGLEALG